MTWDNHSLFWRDPPTFRLPVPSLWIDLFEKVKVLGMSTVSFYVDWAQLEGKPGEFRAEGIFDYAKFMEAAKEAGIYLIARPGPYVNAEASGGGFPGWLQRLKGHLRTPDEDFLAATDNYIANIAGLIANYQITNGGPGFLFPDPDYMQYVEDQARKAGIVVPFMSNDAWTEAHNAPGTGKGEMDILREYIRASWGSSEGHDGYPLGFDCSNPSSWPAGALPTTWYETHMQQIPPLPIQFQRYFQGGSFDPWGGYGFAQCAELVNHEQVRIFYKNLYAAGVTIFNVYMHFGGTNWGNLGHPGVYTSYDYAAAIAEDRTIAREKYSELKLQANFLKVTPGYLNTTPEISSQTGVYSSNLAVTVTPVVSPDGGFWVVRHTDYQLTQSTLYTITVPTSKGKITIPQLGGSLTLGRRDSKIFIFTWQSSATRRSWSSMATWKVKGDRVTVKLRNKYIVAQWKSATQRRILQIGDLHVYIVDRNSAYDYWVPELSPSSLIVNGGYLIRSASIKGNSLYIRADSNSTTTFELIGVPRSVRKIYVNDSPADYKTNSDGNWVADANYHSPKLSLPNLPSLDWHYSDSLPEISQGYDDSAWPSADHIKTNNSYAQPFLTPVSLYGSDYGFHAGALVFRGHFTATGAEKQLYLTTKGGSAFAPSYVFTVLVDNMGLDENWVIDVDEMKNARGILDYALPSDGGGSTQNMTWKITGNLGGESYADKARGPFNEGGLYVERQDFHQPKPPLTSFRKNRDPFKEILAPAMAFHTAKLNLNIPLDKFDVPLSFVFENSTSSGTYAPGFTSTGSSSADLNWIGLAVWATAPGGARVPGLKLSSKTPLVEALSWKERKEAY
ncbi:glycoside hydrolase family 35 protein [Apodospora peruviana]|uniref:beta-galactosidase n=1 Tax=Apodospora peruviana TaxID=516989 RepID=A0AAE0MFQ5_9PEZI|nr:glycoside hydrolase family 35 protein [Apodospora peruviana]